MSDSGNDVKVTASLNITPFQAALKTATDGLQQLSALVRTTAPQVARMTEGSRDLFGKYVPTNELKTLTTDLNAILKASQGIGESFGTVAIAGFVQKLNDAVAKAQKLHDTINSIGKGPQQPAYATQPRGFNLPPAVETPLVSVSMDKAKASLQNFASAAGVSLDVLARMPPEQQKSASSINRTVSELLKLNQQFVTNAASAGEFGAELTQVNFDRITSQADKAVANLQKLQNGLASARRASLEVSTGGMTHVGQLDTAKIDSLGAGPVAPGINQAKNSLQALAQQVGVDVAALSALPPELQKVSSDGDKFVTTILRANRQIIELAANSGELGTALTNIRLGGITSEIEKASEAYAKLTGQVQKSATPLGPVANSPQVQAALAATTAQLNKLSQGTVVSVAALNSMEEADRRLVSSLTPVTGKLVELSQRTQQVLQSAERLGPEATVASLRIIGSDAKKASGDLTNLSFATAGATREFIVLGHEIFTGRFANLAGSIPVLAERLSGLASIFSLLNNAAVLTSGVGIAGVAIAVGTMAYQLHEGARAVSDTQSRLIVLGQGLDFTKGEIQSWADDFKTRFGESNAVTREVMDTLNQLGPAATSVRPQLENLIQSFAQINKVSTSDAVKIFQKEIGDTASSALKYAESIQAVTPAQGEFIESLIKGGDEVKAWQDIMQAIDDRFSTQTSKIRETKAEWIDYFKILSGAGPFGISPELYSLAPTGPLQVDARRNSQAQSPLARAAEKTAINETKDLTDLRDLQSELNLLVAREGELRLEAAAATGPEGTNVKIAAKAQEDLTRNLIAQANVQSKLREFSGGAARQEQVRRQEESFRAEEQAAEGSMKKLQDIARRRAAFFQSNFPDSSKAQEAADAYVDIQRKAADQSFRIGLESIRLRESALKTQPQQQLEIEKNTVLPAMQQRGYSKEGAHSDEYMAELSKIQQLTNTVNQQNYEVFAASQREMVAEANKDWAQIGAIYQNWLKAAENTFGKGSVQWIEVQRSMVQASREAVKEIFNEHLEAASGLERIDKTYLSTFKSNMKSMVAEGKITKEQEYGFDIEYTAKLDSELARRYQSIIQSESASREQKARANEKLLQLEADYTKEVTEDQQKIAENSERIGKEMAQSFSKIFDEIEHSFKDVLVGLVTGQANIYDVQKGLLKSLTSIVFDTVSSIGSKFLGGQLAKLFNVHVEEGKETNISSVLGAELSKLLGLTPSVSKDDALKKSQADLTEVMKHQTGSSKELKSSIDALNDTIKQAKSISGTNTVPLLSAGGGKGTGGSGGMEPGEVGASPGSGFPQVVSKVANAAPELSVERKALVAALAGGEAKDFNVLYGGRTFKGYDTFPFKDKGSFGPAGLPTHAAGILQFEPGTYKKLGMPDFTPHSQVTYGAADAAQIFKEKTGKDLDETLKSGNLDTVATALKGEWPGGAQGFSERYRQALALLKSPQYASAGLVTPQNAGEFPANTPHLISPGIPKREFTPIGPLPELPAAFKEPPPTVVPQVPNLKLPLIPLPPTSIPHPVIPGQPSTPKEPPFDVPIPPAPSQEEQHSSLLGSFLSAINPIGTAHAAETNPGSTSYDLAVARQMRRSGVKQHPELGQNVLELPKASLGSEGNSVPSLKYRKPDTVEQLQQQIEEELKKSEDTRDYAKVRDLESQISAVKSFRDSSGSNGSSGGFSIRRPTQALPEQIPENIYRLPVPELNPGLGPSISPTGRPILPGERMGAEDELSSNVGKAGQEAQQASGFFASLGQSLSSLLSKLSPISSAHAAEAVGDSITVGLVKAGVSGKISSQGTSPTAPDAGTAQNGRTPSEILEYINNQRKLNPKAFAGQDIFLSTGATNTIPLAPEAREQELQLIPKLVSTLKESGTKSITILGTGAGVSHHQEFDEVLKRTAEDQGVGYTGPLKGTPSGRWHPLDYDVTRKQAEEAMSSMSPTAPPVVVAAPPAAIAAAPALVAGQASNQTASLAPAVSTLSANVAANTGAVQSSAQAAQSAASSTDQSKSAQNDNTANVRQLNSTLQQASTKASTAGAGGGSSLPGASLSGATSSSSGSDATLFDKLFGGLSGVAGLGAVAGAFMPGMQNSPIMKYLTGGMGAISAVSGLFGKTGLLGSQGLLGNPFGFGGDSGSSSSGVTKAAASAAGSISQLASSSSTASNALGSVGSVSNDLGSTLKGTLTPALGSGGFFNTVGGSNGGGLLSITGLGQSPATSAAMAGVETTQTASGITVPASSIPSGFSSLGGLGSTVTGGGFLGSGYSIGQLGAGFGIGAGIGGGLGYLLGGQQGAAYGSIAGGLLGLGALLLLEGGGVIPSAADGLFEGVPTVNSSLSSSVRGHLNNLIQSKHSSLASASGKSRYISSAIPRGLGVSDGKGGRLAVVHPGELVLPARETTALMHATLPSAEDGMFGSANDNMAVGSIGVTAGGLPYKVASGMQHFAYSDMASGNESDGGEASFGGPIHLHVHAIDSKSGADFLMKHASTIGSAIRREINYGAMSTRTLKR